jgi:transposase
MRSGYRVAGIDVHKKMLAVVIGRVGATGDGLSFEHRRFTTTASGLQELKLWLSECNTDEVVMESTAQYWRPVWLTLEGTFKLHLAQARSNAGPAGRKNDFRDAERAVRRLLSGDLRLSYVPDAEQRLWRLLSRTKRQLGWDRVRLHSQIESLLEEAQIKLSSVITDLLGVSGRRILRALVNGERDPEQLAALGHERLHASKQQLQDALTGSMHRLQGIVLGQYLDRVETIERQIAELDAELMAVLEPHQDVIRRLCAVPGIGISAAQQLIAEIGPTAAVFPSGAQLSSWVGVCPGREESAGVSASDRSPKGNRVLRGLLTQVAHAAVAAKGSYFQERYRRMVSRLGPGKAIWAIAHRILRLVWKILHQGVEYVEHGARSGDPRATLVRGQRMLAALRRMGYNLQVLAPPNTQPPASTV